MKTSFPSVALLTALIAPAAMARLNVVATTPDLGAIAAAVGGSHITVSTLARPTEDPHFVDPKPSFVVKLNRADVLIDGGAELESGWLDPLLQGARNSRIAPGRPGRVAASEGIALQDVPATLDRSQGDIHAAGNPHYLLDPLNAKTVAARLARTFSQLDPDHESAFQSGLARFNEQLDAKLAEWQALLAPFRGRPVVTYHNYWIYFGRRFGLPMDLYLEPKPGIPPSPAHLASVITEMKRTGARVIVVQPYQNRRTAETVAQRAQAVILDWPSFPTETSPEAYLDWLDQLVRSAAHGFESAQRP